MNYCKKFKILHVITGLDTGGAEIMLTRLLSRMNQNTLDLAVLSLQGMGKLGEKIRSLGIPVYCLSLRQGFSLFLAWNKVSRVLRKFPPDLIQGWMYHANLAAYIMKMGKFLHRPVLWNIRQSLSAWHEEKRTTRFIIWLGKKLSSQTDGIIYNSHLSASQHESFGYSPAKTTILPNGFDTNEFCPCPESRVSVRRELGLAVDTPLIGLIARYHPVKGHSTFLQSAAKLAQTYPKVHFVLAGYQVDSHNPTLVRQILALGIQEKVHLLGERKDIARLTAAMDIATSSSYAEGFSNTLGEAMSCGIPCVATDVGDSRLLLKDCGILVTPKDPDSLYLGWKQILEMEPNLRISLGQKARERIIEHYSLDRICLQYQNLWMEKICQGCIQ